MPNSHEDAPEHPAPPKAHLIGIGLIAGLVGGLTGGGGGIVTVPALDHATKLRRAEIHGTSTAVNACIALAAVISYLIQGGAIDLAAGPYLMAGGLLGAPVGARLANRANELVLRGLFAAVLIAAGTSLVFWSAPSAPVHGYAFLPVPIVSTGGAVALCAAIIGFIIGIWSAAMGLGGGVLAVPALVLLFGSEQHVAAGTSLCIMLPNAISGTLAHFRERTISPRTSTTLGLAALAGSCLGITFALQVHALTLKYIFVCFLSAALIKETIALIRRIR